MLFSSVDLNFDDFFAWSSCSKTRGHSYKLFYIICAWVFVNTFSVKELSQFGITWNATLLILAILNASKCHRILRSASSEPSYIFWALVAEGSSSSRLHLALHTTDDVVDDARLSDCICIIRLHYTYRVQSVPAIHHPYDQHTAPPSLAWVKRCIIIIKKMWPVATDIAWSVSLFVCLFVSVGHNRDPCKSGWTDGKVR